MVTTSSTESDVEGVDADLLATSSNILSSKHGRIRGSLVTVSLDLHSTSHTNDGFTSRKIGNVNEGIIERSIDMSNSENQLAWSNLGSELDDFFFLLLLNLATLLGDSLLLLGSLSRGSSAFLGLLLTLGRLSSFLVLLKFGLDCKMLKIK